MCVPSLWEQNFEPAVHQRGRFQTTSLSKTTTAINQKKVFIFVEWQQRLAGYHVNRNLLSVWKCSVCFSKEFVFSLEKSRYPWIKQWNPVFAELNYVLNSKVCFQMERIPKSNKKSACPDVMKSYCLWLPEITVHLLCLLLLDSSSSATITWLWEGRSIIFFPNCSLYTLNPAFIRRWVSDLVILACHPLAHKDQS